MTRLPASLAFAGCWLLAATVLVPRPAAGQAAPSSQDPPTAYAALRLVGKTLGAEAINRVVEVSGRGGDPQPGTWTIVLKEGAGTREVDVVNGRIGEQRPADRPAPGPAVRLQDLNLDSSGAFEATNAQAKKVKVRFDSINYLLRVSEKTGKPAWTLELLDQQGASAGTVRLAAHDGTVTSLSGRISREAPPATATAKASATPRPRTERPPTTTTTVTDRPVERRPATTTTTTTTTTNNVTRVTPSGGPPPLVDVPDSNQPGTETLPPPAEEEGGLFTRTGRTLDHTSRRVTRSLDRAGRDVNRGLRRAGGSIQRFFTGRDDVSGEVEMVPAPAPADNTQPD